MQAMTYKKRIPLATPHLSGEEMTFIQESLTDNWIAPAGPHVDAFEKEIADYAGVKGAVAVNSGTSAIHLALSLLNVGVGDVVFCSTLTFIASANPVIYQGAELVFIDSEPETWNMSPEALERALEDAVKKQKIPKAVIVVDLYGQSAKMKEICAICSKYEVPILEDAAEALGSFYHGQSCGSFGEFGVFSFNGNKIITTSGGGMILSNNTEALRRAKFLATQAKEIAPHYQHKEVGYNYRLSNILAGIGRAQLQVLPERIEQKRLIFKTYLAALAEIDGLSFLQEQDDTFSNRWLTVVTLEHKDSVTRCLQAFANENIEARPMWKPLHMQPLFKEVDFFEHQENLSVSEQLFDRGICLPSGTNMTEEDLERVINCMKKTLMM